MRAREYCEHARADFTAPYRRRHSGSHHRREVDGTRARRVGFHTSSDPDTVRAPDVAFVRQARASLIPSRGYARLAPDLVIEIRSPDHRRGEVLAKVGEWLDAGTELVWVIDPQRSEAHVYRRDGSVGVVASDGMLDGEESLPGFRCGLREVFR